MTLVEGMTEHAWKGKGIQNASKANSYSSMLQGVNNNKKNHTPTYFYMIDII
jgi:hypothetical protein